jgi:hypothetical protein
MATAALTVLDDARQAFWSAPERYPRGLGPLQRVIDRLRAGEIGSEDAMELAKAPDCASQLSHAYLRVVFSRLEAEADDDVTFALTAAEVALEAALAMPWPLLALDALRAAAEGFIRIVHRGLMRRPDGRLYARAIEIGEWALRDADQNGKPALKGAYLHWLGTMSLDAYGGNFPPSRDFPERVRTWLMNAIDPMPDVTDGLARARAYLSRAVEFRPPGRERGRTLKALMETMVYQSHATGLPVDAADLTALAERAIADLDPVADDQVIARVLQLRSLSVA